MAPESIEAVVGTSEVESRTTARGVIGFGLKFVTDGNVDGVACTSLLWRTFLFVVST